MSSREITFDNNYLYVDQEKFFPILHEMGDCADSLDSVNGVVIYVDCGKDADFKWEEATALAEKGVELGKWILWELDFHLQEDRIFLQDTSTFYSCGIAVEEFVKTLAAPFSEHTLSVSLFRGGVDFAKYFLWTEEHERHYLEKQKESLFLGSDPSLDSIGRKLFAADVFSEYLHRIASFLPDTLVPCCFLDASSVENSAFLALLLSRERFQHLLLALKHANLPLGCLNWEDGRSFGGWVGRGAPYFAAVHDVTLGVCVPLEDNMTKDLMDCLSKVFAQLDKMEVSYRVISELYLSESWDGIDELVVLSAGLSAQGIRKLKGFLAAGGKVVYADAPTGLESEISLREFVH